MAEDDEEELEGGKNREERKGARERERVRGRETDDGHQEQK